MEDMLEGAKLAYLKQIELHKKILEDIDKENKRRKNLPWYKRVIYPQLKVTENVSLFEDDALLFAEAKARLDLKLYEQMYYHSLYYTPMKPDSDKLSEEDYLFKIIIKVFKH